MTKVTTFEELAEHWKRDAERCRVLAKNHPERSHEHIRYIEKAATLENCSYLLGLMVQTECVASDRRR